MPKRRLSIKDTIKHKVFATIFTTLNESKHNLENSAINSNVGNRKKESSQPVVVINDDEESLSDKLDSLELPDSFNHSNQRTIRSNRNNRDRSHSESSQVLLGDRDPILRQNQPKHLSPPQSQRHRHHSKSLSTASSSLLLEDEETSAFPPADDVISDDEDAINGAIIDDVVDRAFQRRSSDDDELGVNNNNNNNNGYSSVSESSILAMDDVCSLVLYDAQPLPKTAVDYYTQKSRSVDNLDGGPPINSVVPSTDTSDGSNHLNTPPPSHTKGGSMNDLLDSSSGHSGGNSGVSGGGVRNMGGRRSEGRVTVHSTTNASTHLKCTVKGGTVDVLIAYATQDSIDDWRFYEAFLTTYRTFISVEELLTKLIVRYRILHHLASSAITNGSSYGLRQREKRLRTAKNCFFLFLRTAWELKRDTEVDRAGPLIAQFRSVLIAVKEERDAKLLSDLMHAKLTDNSNNGYYDHLSSSEGSQQNSPSPLSLNSPSSINRTRQLTDFKSKAIAEQLTLICSKLFQSIELSEILACAKSGSGGREDQMPNVLAFTRHWNKLSNWVASCVLSAGATSDGHNHEKQIRERTHLKFIKVLKHLSEMNNFSSCFAVLCGLNINPVSRLDWPKSSIETLSSVSELLSPFHHFRNYREALSLSQGACIPHLAIVLHDLQQIAVMDDTLAVSHSHQNRSDIDSDIGGSSAVINFTKRWHQYLCLVRLRDTGSMHYYIKENAEIMTCFADFEPCLDESELHRMSNAIKPRRT
ncbi:guanine nucleotide-releasing factor 2-like isoform X2 [Convolutriloba macropyga]|uniref:guanine nucleotide-releasing factor 2-like isoform X2 n=1 Tax=Convolutriloba macropyga TaxID=536237 RepID=UPI003F52686A